MGPLFSLLGWIIDRTVPVSRSDAVERYEKHPNDHKKAGLKWAEHQAAAWVIACNGNAFYARNLFWYESQDYNKRQEDAVIKVLRRWCSEESVAELEPPAQAQDEISALIGVRSGGALSEGERMVATCLRAHCDERSGQPDVQAAYDDFLAGTQTYSGPTAGPCVIEANSIFRRLLTKQAA